MKIVFFDGYCSLCNGLVDWLMKVDKTGELKFASLQGENAKKLLEKNSMPLDINTVIYLRDDQKYDRSTAILMIFSDVGGVWRLARVFFIIPKFIRDLIYKLIANNRYRVFGKRNSCRIPTKQELDRLLP
jgi:predicted DCC family thiol-disulfide oxidoreductase YuxK